MDKLLDRLDAIELDVAAGRVDVIQCFTQMRELIQLVSADRGREAGQGGPLTTVQPDGRSHPGQLESQAGGIMLDAGEVKFLAARLRRLCAKFNYSEPERDDVFLVSIAAPLIGILLSKMDRLEGASHTPLSPASPAPAVPEPGKIIDWLHQAYDLGADAQKAVEKTGSVAASLSFQRDFEALIAKAEEFASRQTQGSEDVDR